MIKSRFMKWLWQHHNIHDSTIWQLQLLNMIENNQKKTQQTVKLVNNWEW